VVHVTEEREPPERGRTSSSGSLCNPRAAGGLLDALVLGLLKTTSTPVLHGDHGDQVLVEELIDVHTVALLPQRRDDRLGLMPVRDENSRRLMGGVISTF